MTAPINDNPSGTDNPSSNDNQIILSLSKDPGPVTEAARITSLDLIRGVAVLGILLMNAVSFRYGLAPYLNLSAGGSDTPLDWAIGIFGEIFIDQKFMALFSLLFGAGILLFIERARQREKRPILLNLWCNALLLGIGILHSLIWDGDVLIVYAVSALFLITLSKLPAKALIAIGALVFLLSIPNFLLMQYIADNSAAPLTGVWEPVAQEPPATPSQPQSGTPQNLPGTMLSLTLLGYFVRGLGLILMGAGLYRPRLHARRSAPPNLPPDRRHRPSIRPPPRRRRSRHHPPKRLLPRNSLHRPNPQHRRHHPRRPRPNEPDHPMAPPSKRRPPKTPPPGRRTNVYCSTCWVV